MAREQPEVASWLNNLDKILADEVQIIRNEQGQIIQSSGVAQEEEGYLPHWQCDRSRGDLSRHGDQMDFGYNVGVVTTGTVHSRDRG